MILLITQLYGDLILSQLYMIILDPLRQRSLQSTKASFTSDIVK